MKDLSLSYAVFVGIADETLEVYWTQNSDGSYVAYCMTQDFFCSCDVIGDDIADFEAIYKKAPNEVDSLDDAYANAWLALGKAKLPIVTSTGAPGIVTLKSNDLRRTLVTFDMCDKTTWYPKSTRVVDEIPTHDLLCIVYTLAHDYVIDTYHGNITDEDYLKDANGLSYRVAVKVNDVLKTEQNPHTGTGGDYTIDYAAGTITFATPRGIADVVKVTYYYASDSTFTIKPNPGKKLSVQMCEFQFAIDCVIKDSIIFQPYGYVQSFAPQYSPVPYPAFTLIPIGDTSVYKGTKDYLNVSVRAYPSLPALGGTGWRGAKESVVLDWDYVSTIDLDSARGMEVRLRLEHDIPWDGCFATATFYCTEK